MMLVDIDVVSAVLRVSDKMVPIAVRPPLIRTVSHQPRLGRQGHDPRLGVDARVQAGIGTQPWPDPGRRNEKNTITAVMSVMAARHTVCAPNASP